MKHSIVYFLLGNSYIKHEFPMCCVLSHSNRVWCFATPWTVAHQAPLSMGFSRQEYWNGLPCLPPVDLPNPGIEPESLLSPALAGGFFFFFFFFKLYNIVLVLPYIEMNPPQVYMCSPSWTLLPPPSPYHPSGSSQCTSPKHPVSYIEPGLVTRFIYDIIHISMPFSQIIPPSPSPTESKRLFYTSMSLLLSRYRVIVTIFLNSIYMR